VPHGRTHAWGNIARLVDKGLGMYRSCCRSLRLFPCVILAVLWWCTGVSHAQTTPTPTPEQLEIFNSMTPEQQRAILESMTSGSGSIPTDGTRDDDLPTETVRPGTSKALEDWLLKQQELEEPTIRGGDTVLVRPVVKAPAEGAPRPSAAKLETERRFLSRITRGNPYKLDPAGVLVLSGIAPIPLAGLTEEQASARLSNDPALEAFDVTVQLLPLEKREEDALEPFGYDLFEGVPTTFAPVTDVPVPAEYVVGPGDRLEIQLIGNTKARHSLVVNRDGRVNFPDLGPIQVAGLRFETAKARIEERVAEELIGTQANVTISDLRTIRVFVLGEAEMPGSYTVSALSTITNALLASGGVKRIGSLRNIQLKRRGAVVARLDLYDLLLNGDTSNDARLLPGDVIFIPPVGTTVGVVGEIRRPAIYELKGESSVADLVQLGGGLAPTADSKLARIERIDDRRDRVVIDVDLSQPQAGSTGLRNGDLLRIPSVRTAFESSVSLMGHVYRPGQFQFRPGMRLTDVIGSVRELKANADQHYVLVRREDARSRRISVVSADLELALQAPGSQADIPLQPRDSIVVFDVEAGRRQYMAPILEQLQRQATSLQPAQIVRVTGQVREPGEYPLEPGMRVADLIRAGGGLAENAYEGAAELARYEVRDGGTRATDVMRIGVQAALAGDPDANLNLAPADFLVVKEISEWSRQESITLAGEVRFPGEYPIERGETLKQVIARAGGLTPLAFTEGSVFTRESLREREAEQLKMLANRLRQDLGALALQSAQIQGARGEGSPSETLAVGQSLLNELTAAEAVGRLVIDLPRVMNAAAGSSDDLMLRDGDRLIVPRQSQEVTILGEVQNATSMLYDPSMDRDEYILQSGGMTQRADDERVYVVRANGSVDADTGSAWFSKSQRYIRPGDTIVVPLDAERMRPLPMWAAITTIIYNLAVAVAAVGSF
jgi:polysaccharide export outer membrane protein